MKRVASSLHRFVILLVLHGEVRCGVRVLAGPATWQTQQQTVLEPEAVHAELGSFCGQQRQSGGCSRAARKTCEPGGTLIPTVLTGAARLGSFQPWAEAKWGSKRTLWIDGACQHLYQQRLLSGCANRGSTQCGQRYARRQ